SKRIVFFGGAGVSTESGIPDYRSVDGLYHQKFDYPPEIMLSHDFLLYHTEKFFEFYKNKFIYLGAQPNAAHLKLAELEQAGKLTAVITQNCDGLHQAAGSKTVYELHGSVHRNHCMKCGKPYGVDYVLQAEGVPLCECGGVVRPDVVLYGEGLDTDTTDGALEAIAQADMMIIGGTSMMVYPAASLAMSFRGKNLVVINRDYTQAESRASLVINGKIGEVLSQIVCG
ncbi:MAG: NAD-dependent protein deacylase, partial [Ruminococcaceae bacterium]|nr:NAD-dependent protein deacylase [Oscillospiraceae bacterium]